MMPSVDEHGGPRPAASATLQGIRPRLARATINMRLIAIVLTLAVPLNIVVALVIWRLASAANEAQRTSLLYAARSIATAVDAEFGKYISLARMLSHHPDLQTDNLDGLEAELRGQLADIPNTCAIVADWDGRQLLNTEVPKGQPLPLRPSEAM
jgi:hypothetical protein